MRNKPLTQYIDSADLSMGNGAAAKLTSKTRKVNVPNIGAPLDCLMLTFEIAMAAVPTVAPYFLPMGLAELIKQIRFIRYPRGRGPETIIDVSGPGLLEYNLQTEGPWDQATMNAVHIGATPANADAATYYVTMTVPFGHPQLADGPGLPLRCYTLADIHNDLQPPILEITTEDSDNVTKGTANATFTTFNAHVWAIYREITQDFENEIQARGGYLRWDLTEGAKFSPAVAGAGAVPIPAPGMCSGLLIRSWSNKSAVVNTQARGLPGAARARWNLVVAKNNIREFTMEDLVKLNQRSTPPLLYRDAANAVYDVYPSGSYYLDFITDGIGADPSGDFGSILPIPTAINTELRGTFTGTDVQVAMISHRFYDDLSPARFMTKTK